MKIRIIFISIIVVLCSSFLNAQIGVQNSSTLSGNQLSYCYYNQYATPQFKIYTINEDGTGNTKIITSTYGLNHHSYSPDGNYITATGYIDANLATWNIFTYNISTGSLVRLTNTLNVWDAEPNYSPNGSLIVYSRTYPNLGSRNEIWIMNSDGTNNHYVGVQGFLPRFSPDGTKFVYTTTTSSGWDIHTCNIDGSNVRRITNNSSDEFAPYWSPDGNKITYTSTRDGNEEIYVMNSDGSNETRITFNNATDTQPKWSPDGAKIAFSSQRLGVDKCQIFLMNTDGSNVVQVTYAVFPSYAITPTWKPISPTGIEQDGKKLIPSTFRLYQNYPNPFNPSTTIKFSNSIQQKLQLNVYDSIGRRVACLANREFESGEHMISWNGKNDNGIQLASGIFYFRLSSGLSSTVLKGILLK